MRRWGGTLLGLGLGSLVLPFVGLQFRALRAVEGMQPVFGLLLAAAGGTLLFLSFRSGE